MPSSPPINKKVRDAAKLYDAWQSARAQNRTCARIIRQPLPQHKRQHYGNLFARTIVAMTNTANRFEEHYKKLTPAERVQLYGMYQKVPQ